MRAMTDETKPLLTLDDDKVCYFCLEPCDTESPCPCKQPLHPKCLKMIQRKTRQERCTICRQPYFKPVRTFCDIIIAGLAGLLTILMTLVFCSICAIFFGYIGQTLLSIFCECDDSVESQWYGIPLTDFCFISGFFIMCFITLIIVLIYKHLNIGP
tara:strand:+ start:4013 stop:4480 length:468 start_codon:yes stop_codon:yes gene_type:complete